MLNKAFIGFMILLISGFSFSYSFVSIVTGNLTFLEHVIYLSMVIINLLLWLLIATRNIKSPPKPEDKRMSGHQDGC